MDSTSGGCGRTACSLALASTLRSIMEGYLEAIKIISPTGAKITINTLNTSSRSLRLSISSSFFRWAWPRLPIIRQTQANQALYENKALFPSDFLRYSDSVPRWQGQSKTGCTSE
ncbi:hypothetical protein PSPTOT1_3556 [Pseudomonas syringae pv. tomato T1]|nr:hypothetical protein PSPTOT1_3556 [Pseudomonas syringae pv. tomato T1]